MDLTLCLSGKQPPLAPGPAYIGLPPTAYCRLPTAHCPPIQNPAAIDGANPRRYLVTLRCQATDERSRSGSEQTAVGSTCVVGLQWGDEAKGKIVDLLCDQHDVVVRYQGGANAGHTVVHEGSDVQALARPDGHPPAGDRLRHRQRRGDPSARAAQGDRRLCRPRGSISATGCTSATGRT